MKWTSFTRFGTIHGLLLLDHLVEPLNLLLVLPEHCVFGILVDLRLVLYVLGTIRVS